MAEFVRFPIGTKAQTGDGRSHSRITVHRSNAAVNRAVAKEIADLIRAKTQRGERAVLGLATGSTPTGVYEELVRLHREEKLSFRNVVTFNLDEYWPMPPDALQSYQRFMREYLFDHIDIDRENIHIPDGTLRPEDVSAFCEDYERQIRELNGIDFQILGVGRTGHIGFNEPGSPRDSRTRLITLDKVTRMDAAGDFFGEWNVPRRAITMGVGTILAARRIVLIAFGESKARIIREAVEGPVTNTVAASFLQEHPNVEFVLDQAAASELTPVKTPWLWRGNRAMEGARENFGFWNLDFGLKEPPAESQSKIQNPNSKWAWDTALTKRAVIWLAREVKKPILKLVAEDYNEHGLQELLAARQDSAYDVNIEVFKTLQNTITGWPGGKPGAEGNEATGQRGNEAIRGAEGPRSRGTKGEEEGSLLPSAPRPLGPLAPVFPKRVVVFSPHPDDDVISMGGTLIRLCEQGHEVHVAYQTSGNIAVFDEKAVRHADFVTEFCQAFELFSKQEAERIEQAVQSFVHAKRPGEIDSPELQKIKALIRRSEARAAAHYCGVKSENIHFLDMPFYETGRVKKKPLGDADIRIVMDLLQQVRPHQIYAAGDLSDPHGTHRVCLAAITAAVERLSKQDWMSACEVWLYRGAWQEWGPHEIEMAVPLSPDEVERKKMAIFYHESQKDKALFPGPWDTREFWQRAEDRNRNTAELYDRLGLPEYQAMEAFVRWRPMAE